MDPGHQNNFYIGETCELCGVVCRFHFKGAASKPPRPTFVDREVIPANSLRDDDLLEMIALGNSRRASQLQPNQGMVHHKLYAVVLLTRLIRLGIALGNLGFVAAVSFRLFVFVLSEQLTAFVFFRCE